jgi:hypothetical protein
MNYFIQGTIRSCPDTNVGSCRDFNKFAMWNLSVCITILLGRTLKSIGLHHNSIGLYCEIYRFASQFYWFVLSFYQVISWFVSPSVQISAKFGYAYETSFAGMCCLPFSTCSDIIRGKTFFICIKNQAILLWQHASLSEEFMKLWEIWVSLFYVPPCSGSTVIQLLCRSHWWL